MGLLKDAYKALFGKSYAALWQTFALQSGGSYFDQDESVEVVYLGHTIKFDIYTHYTVVGTHSRDTEFTRVRMEFPSPEKLSLKLMKGDLMDTIGKLFGAQDIKVGYSDFDRKFVIKGNDVTKAQLIFSHEKLRELTLEQEDIGLLISEEGIFDEMAQEGNVILYYISREKIRQVEQLETLLKMYQLLIDQLKRACVIN